MAAVVDDGWEDGWQTTASGNGGSGRWQAVGGNVEQRRTTAAAARKAADNDAVIVGGEQQWQRRGCVKLCGVK